jgi:PBSX family phage terminase large subunit
MEYELFPKQDDFVFDTHRFSGYGGGFGNGKTLAGAIKTYNHCLQKDAFFLVGRRHATDLQDSTQRDFLQLFGHMGKFSPGNKTFKFYDKDGPRSEVIFRHLDDLQSLTNMNLSGFWIDQAEEVSEDAFDFLIGRIRRPVDRREGFITFNMEGHNWIWRRFFKKIGRDGKVLPNAEDYSLVTASTLENKNNLPEDYLKGLLSQNEAYIKRFVYGSWDTFSGQIFDEFSPLIHVVEPFPIPSGWEKIRGIDHGQSGEHATGCLWAAVDYVGNVYIYMEYKKYNDIVSNHAKMINQMSQVNIDGQVVADYYNYTVIDPSTHAKNKVSKDGYSFSVADEYSEHGIATIGGQNDVIAGINRVKEYLKVDPLHYHPFKQMDGEPILGAPHLYIFSSCAELIEEIQQYKWKQAFGANTNTDADDIKERPRKKNDHLVDPLRYIIMSRPQRPEHLNSIAPWVFQNPIELARRAQSMGMTVDDLIAVRHHQTTVRHSATGITHSSGISHQESLQSK